ncbi:hypothetical protein GIB67_030733 [Kingdonia uniflora]|uniref:Uncharacterized protein n=1 Tax=Kingdonia uniflora TaxID=39325 RepID=A0A7J7L317_9MAGN|nr:hypothetical protein GIB67_030733 [Kingdonia uniflora]
MAYSAASQPLVTIQPLEGDMSTDGSNTIPFPDVLKALIAKLCPVFQGYLVVVPIGLVKYGDIGSRESKLMPRGKVNEARKFNDRELMSIDSQVSSRILHSGYHFAAPSSCSSRNLGTEESTS